MKTKAGNGLEAEVLAQSAYNVFRRVCGSSLTGNALREWEELGDDQASWADVAVVAIDMIDLPADEMATKELSVSTGSHSLYRAFAAAQGGDDMWSEIGENVRKSWEAVLRHLANLIDSDGSLDMGEAEGQAVEWMTERMLQEA